MRRVHTINLSGAWEPPATDGAPWTRRFGRPDGLSTDVRLWLVLEHGAGVGPVMLNGVSLAAAVPVPGQTLARWEITGVLAPRNVLTMLLPAAATGRSAPAEAPSAQPHGRRPLPPACGRVWIEIEAIDRGACAR